MPILADALVEPIKEDEGRYLQMIADGDLEENGLFTFKGIGYKLFVGTDRHIQGLSGCRLIVLFKGDDCVYSCYYKMAENQYFGNRVVQIEVRQAQSLPGLARHVMRNYFLRHYDSIRTDLSSTPQGRNMWQQFYIDHRKEKELFFYQGLVNIDLRKSDGSNNQDASCPELVFDVRAMRNACTVLREGMWHDNKQGNVVVIYASNKPLWTKTK